MDGDDEAVLGLTERVRPVAGGSLARLALWREETPNRAVAVGMSRRLSGLLLIASSAAPDVQPVADALVSIAVPAAGGMIHAAGRALGSADAGRRIIRWGGYIRWLVHQMGGRYIRWVGTTVRRLYISRVVHHPVAPAIMIRMSVSAATGVPRLRAVQSSLFYSTAGQRAELLSRRRDPPRGRELGLCARWLARVPAQRGERKRRARRKAAGVSEGHGLRPAQCCGRVA